MLQEVGPLEVDEVKAIRFDFSSELAGAASLQGEPLVTVMVIDGVDPNPDNVKVSPATISGNEVLQMVRAGVAGVTYKLRAKASDNTGLTHGMSVKMGVVNG